MTFDTQQLFDTHKRKFCVGSTVDPARIHSRISGKGGPRNERKDKDGSQTVSKTAEYMYVQVNHYAQVTVHAFVLQSHERKGANTFLRPKKR